jgi:hypothetical protein
VRVAELQHVAMLVIKCDTPMKIADKSTACGTLSNHTNTVTKNHTMMNTTYHTDSSINPWCMTSRSSFVVRTAGPVQSHVTPSPGIL